MEGVLWHVLASSRGGERRLELVLLLDARPRNANELADAMDIDYTTVRHHLDVLTENQVVEAGSEGYGAVYLPTQQARDHWDIIEEIRSAMEDT